MTWQIYLKQHESALQSFTVVNADELTYDVKRKLWVFKRYKYDSDEVVAVFPREGINGILRA